MAIESRDEPLILSDNPAVLSAYGLYTFAALVEQTYPEAPPIGSTAAPAREAVRFRATQGLGFPPGEISAVRPAPNGHGPLDVHVNLLGLHGPSSPLAPAYTERIMHAEGAGALGDFFDFFNHRLVSLLVQIWKHYRHHLRYEEGARDPMSLVVGALFGLMPREDEDDRDWRVRLLPHAGVLALASRSSRMLAGVISHHLDVPCRVEEFIPRDADIPEEARWRLGSTELVLGVDTVAGETIPDVAGQFRVVLGPLDPAQFDALLPGRPDHAILQKLIGLIVREPLAWDMRLDLAPGSAPEWVLGEAELGWTSLIEPARDAVVPVLL